MVAAGVIAPLGTGLVVADERVVQRSARGAAGVLTLIMLDPSPGRTPAEADQPIAWTCSGVMVWHPPVLDS